MSCVISQVYWIFDESCNNPETSGYVGVSVNALQRFKTHINKKRVPQDSKIQILFEGNRIECFKFEERLRPLKGIGWNLAPGGAHGWRVGFKHSDITREKLVKSWTDERRFNASEFKSEQNHFLTGQKRPKQSLAMLGDKNPMFGKTLQPHVIEALRSSRLGMSAYNRQELYCIGCHKRASISILSKYHNKCFKAFCILNL